MDPDLYKAVTEGDHIVLSKLLEAAVGDLQQEEERSDQNKNTLLHIAANFNNVRVVRVIREKLPTIMIGKKNYRGDTALHIAARHNNAEVVKYLLHWAEQTDLAANQNKPHETAKKKNRDWNTALHEAVLGRHREVIEVLMVSVKELIFIKNKRKESPLYLAADRGLQDVLKKMLEVALEKESSMERKDLRIYDGRDACTALHTAIAKKHASCINILLNKKKELLSRVDANGRNPLHYAALFGHFEEACCMLKIKDAFIAHQKDNNGLYHIHIAANEGHVDIIKAMLKYFPETIEALNDKHQNVVHIAAKSARANLLSYMLHQKSNKFDKLLNAKDINGNTPVHLAAKYSHPRVLSILLLGNVDKSIMNNIGLTALDITEKKNYETFSLPEVPSLTALRINDARNTLKETRKIEHDREMFKKRFNTLGLVATLISTVTFAAGFTVPGGYNADGPYKGIAILLRKPAFNVFVICNIKCKGYNALYLSIIVAVNNIWAQLGDIRLLILAVNLGAPLLGIALIMMVIAFAAGLYSVIYKLQWLALVVLIIGGIFIFYIVVLLVLFVVPYMSKYPVLRQISKWGFNLLIWAFDRLFENRTVD